MKKLNEIEKNTLGHMLKRSIRDNHDLEEDIRLEIRKLTNREDIDRLKQMLDTIYKQRNVYYEIARKLEVK